MKTAREISTVPLVQTFIELEERRKSALGYKVTRHEHGSRLLVCPRATQQIHEASPMLERLI